MKKILLTFIPALALLASCAGDPDTYKVKGTVAKSFLPEGEVSVLFQHKDGKIDEVPVEKRHFKFSEKINGEDIIAVALQVRGQAPGSEKYCATYVPEAGTIKIAIDETSVVSGGDVNTALSEYDQQLNAYMETYFSEAQKIVDEKGAVESASEVEGLREKLAEDIKTLSKGVFDANATNAVGAYAFKNVMQDLTLAEMDEWLANAADFIKNAEATKTVRAEKEAMDATSEGKMFLDFAGKTPAGKDVKLSDFVGKGKYALVDFWASWCRPCKDEIPNIKAAYEQYGKDVNFVGVAVWDTTNEGSRQVVEALGMTWAQIFMGEDSAATDLYGINSIPQIILFGPDGTVVKRGLRGEQIAAQIAAAIAE